jgi:hypothetical protein
LDSAGRKPRASTEQLQSSREMFPSDSDAGDDNDAIAVVDGSYSSWSYSLSSFVGLGLLGQLQVALAEREASTLEEDVQSLLLPLLSCYSPEEQAAALQQLLVEKVATSSSSSSSGSGSSGQRVEDVAAGAEFGGWRKSMLQKVVGGSSSRSTGQAPGVTSTTGSSSSGANTSAGWSWVVALVEREVAVAKRRLAQQQQRQQQQGLQGVQTPRMGGVGGTDEGFEEGRYRLVWVDPAAMGGAVKVVVESCTSTNQWAKVRREGDGGGLKRGIGCLAVRK